MKATEARQVAISHQQTSTNEQYSKIIQAIKLASSKGMLKTYFYELIEPGVKEILTTDGFEIDTQRYRDEVTNTIKW